MKNANVDKENFIKRNRKIQNLMSKLEKDRFSIFTIFVIVFAFGLIRGVLEVLCVECPCTSLMLRGLISNDISTSLSAFFGGTLIIHIFTKEKIKKIWNVAIFGWVIFFIPPIFDVLFFGSCPGYWGFATLEHITESGLWAIIIPLFLLNIGFSPGLIFMGVCSSLFVFLYSMYKTNSWKITFIFMAAIYAFVLFEIAAPFIWYIPSEFSMGMGLIPYPFEWYFYLFIIWGTILLLLNREFSRDLISNINIPGSIAIPAVAAFAMWWSVPYPFHLVYFITLLFMCSFLWISFSIISKFNLVREKDKTLNFKQSVRKIISVFTGDKKYDYGISKSQLSIALILQFSIIYFALLYGHVPGKTMVMNLLIAGVFLPYICLVFKKFSNSKLIKSFFIGLISSLVFLVGYYKRIIDDEPAISQDTIYLTIGIFIAFFVSTYLLSKKWQKRKGKETRR